jgi:hypothetical protein
VFRAGAADLDELLFEGLPGAMDANCGVADGNSSFAGEGLEAGFFQVDLAEYLAVCRLHALKDVADALADDLFGLRLGRCFSFETLGPLLEYTVMDGTMAIVIDDGISQDAVEPGDGRLVVAQFGGLLHCAHVSGLKDVFSRGERVHTSLDEAEKLASLEDEIRYGGGLHLVAIEKAEGVEQHSTPHHII